MGDPIAILPALVIDQIAAGEVVERPASVVRELLDNAIDANATQVHIALVDAGISRIEVSDNGTGMTRADATLCVERHATSKLRSVDDLRTLHTFGFRGEALPSIASVSAFTLHTRRADTDAGTEVCIEHGKKIVRSVACDVGTRVVVADLFASIPARRKFLKANTTETAWVTETVTEIALAHCKVAFELVRDGKRALAFAATATTAERVAQVFAGEPLIAFESSRASVGGTLRLQAFLCAPEHARGGNNLYLYVNGRRVRDRAFSRAVQFGYGALLTPGKFPVGVVFLTLDPATVDVNVHPQKSEVRFADARAVYDAISRMVGDGLGTKAFARGFAPQGTTPVFYPGVPTTDSPLYVQDSATEHRESARQSGTSDPWGLVQASDLSPAVPRMQFLAQSHGAFLVCATEDGLRVFDQHALDEQLRFDELRRAYAAGSVAKQNLLFPERLSLPSVLLALIEKHDAELERMGFSLRQVSEQEVLIRSVPMMVQTAPPAALLREVLHALPTVTEALGFIACHAAVRAGDALTHLEGHGLVQRFAALQELSATAPHAKVEALSVALSDLEKRVGR